MKAYHILYKTHGRHLFCDIPVISYWPCYLAKDCRIGIRAMRGAYLLKSVDKGTVTFVCVILMFRPLQLLYIVYSRQRFLYILLERSSRLNVTFVLTL